MSSFPDVIEVYFITFLEVEEDSVLPRLVKRLRVYLLGSGWDIEWAGWELG
jgi:hypothetical protein